MRLLQMLGFKGVKNEKTGRRRIQPWQRALIPVHLHAKQLTLPDLGKEQVIIKAPLPDYFKMTLLSLRLDPVRAKQKKMKHEKQDRSLKQLGISTRLKGGF